LNDRTELTVPVDIVEANVGFRSTGMFAAREPVKSFQFSRRLLQGMTTVFEILVSSVSTLLP